MTSATTISKPDKTIDPTQVWVREADGASITGAEVAAAIRVLDVAFDLRRDGLLRPLKTAAARFHQVPSLEKKEHKLRFRQKRRQEDAERLKHTQMRRNRLAQLQHLIDNVPQDSLLELLTPANVGTSPLQPHLPLLPPAAPHTDEEIAEATLITPSDSTGEEEGAAAGVTPDQPLADDLYRARKCYVCKTRFNGLHHFYDSLCISCGDLNFAKRSQTADLTGRIALVTGGRIKIGFLVVLKLLRAGASVIVTTRFPRDAAQRFAQEADFGEWKDRLQIHALDLRDLASVQNFAAHLLHTLPHLDILINNAAQTIRRPNEFYQHMMALETAPIAALPSSTVDIVQTHVPDSGANLQALTVHTSNTEASFPSGKYDVFGQQLDLRTTNSWVQKLDTISGAEAAEVQAINAIAPFILNGHLKPLMEQSPFENRYIVNVSAMEGKFYRHKSAYHPHTNMAKAALNMMTRTSAADYAESRIYMTAVDTGWINDERPTPSALRIAVTRDFHCPIDEDDAASRILDPIFDGVNTGQHQFGVFLKDYTQTEW